MSSGADKPEQAERPRSFAVTDRRSLTDEGEQRTAASPAADPPPAPPADAGAPPAPPEPPGPAAAPQAASQTSAGARAPRRLPPVDFPTFVLSLGSSALMHLGEAPHPGSGETGQDLALAKHTIDILSMLEEKTRGNLSQPEAQLLENLLFDLRLRYVEAAKK